MWFIQLETKFICSVLAIYVHEKRNNCYTLA